MKKIIIPTDFSNNAWKAAGYAANIFRNTPCRFILFHAYSEPGTVLEADIPQIISSRIGGVNAELDKIKKEFEEFDHHPDTIIETAARYGADGKAIIQEVKNEFADLIVMGKSGASNSMILGSLTLRILTGLPCPVLCIPENSELAPPEHIMFSTDYHNLTNLDQLFIVKDIADLNKSRISIVNIKKDVEVPVSKDDGLEGLVLHNFFGDIPNDYYDYQEDEVEEGILNYAHQKNVNLIVMLDRKRTFWEELFHISVTDAVGINSDIPLLVIKD